MKKRNLLRFLPIMLATLLLTVSLCACNQTGKNDTTTEADGTTTAPAVEGIEIAVDQYNLIREDGAPASVVSAVSTFYRTVEEKTGVKFAAFTDDFVKDESMIDPAAYEFLIGATNRPESTQALEKIDGFGYVITKIGNKIVINASVGALLDDALTYFVDHYLTPTAANGTFTIPADLLYTESAAGGITLINANNKCDFKIVFQDSLDNVKSSTETKDRTDYVVQYALDLRTDMMKEFKNVNIGLGTDWVRTGMEPDSESYEILVGMTNRHETASFLETLAPNEYGFAAIGNKLVIAGWSDKTIALAVELFTAEMDNYIFTDANGNKNLTMAEGLRVIRAHDVWNTDIPAYEGGVFSGVMEGINTCYQMYYTETNATEYKAYLAKLEAAGYKLHQQNQLDDNLFATYYNDVNMIYVCYTEYRDAVRIVTEQMKDVTLPTLDDSNYTKITNTTFTMMDLDYEAGNFGNAFIITLEDGSFIIHDGGADAGDDMVELYNTLKRLNKRTDGKIHIAAWIISHEHWDHFKNFYDFCVNYKPSIILDEIVYNVASLSVNYNSWNPGSYIKNNYLGNLKTMTGCDLVKIHTGQKHAIRNITIECLYTHEDLFPTLLHTFNDSCIVTRFTIDGQVVTILGDIEDDASDVMVKMYQASTLKTDLLQVAHHGWGATTPLYNKFKPTVLIWPTDANTFAGQTAGTSSGYYQVIDYALYKQPNVKLTIVADGGHKTIPLPLKNISESAITVWQPTRK